MSTLEIFLLGELDIVLDGSPITSKIPIKSQALLAYLAATREPHSRHALAGLFWGDKPDDKAKNSLRVAINGLRQKLPDHLEISRQNLGLKLTSNLQVDVLRLQSAMESSHRGGQSTSHVEQLTQIPQLYRGEFLSNLALEKAPEFDEWLEGQRTNWKQVALRGLTLLADQHLEDEAHNEALKILSHHLEIDPCAEEAHRRAMIAHSRKGDLAAALAQYEACKQSLHSILRIDPAPETTAIYTNLQSAKAQPAQPLPAASASGKLIGRESELTRLRNLLVTPFCRLVTIAGFGGIGKTQLALAMLKEVVQSDTQQFLHGVSFVPLVNVESAYAIPMAVADSLDATLPGKRAPADELIDMLRGKEMLIILDNFEHLIDDGIDLLDRIVRACGEIKLGITCPEWLNIGAEWCIGLEGLPYPAGDGEELDFASIESSPAVEFFLSEVARTVPDFQLKDEDYGPLRRLCQLVAGVPLALMLAAAWVKTKSIQEIADEVSWDLDILTSSAHEMPPRQQSMKVVFDSAWEQLLLHEQAIFKSLSVFRGGFTVDAVASVNAQLDQAPQWTAALDTLDLLASRGLVQYDEAADRYNQHQLIRQFCIEKLNDEPTHQQLVRRNHSIYYFDKLAGLGVQSKGAEQLGALQEYKAETKNITVAWQMVVQRKNAVALAGAVDSLGTFLEWRSSLNQAIRLYQAAEEMLAAEETVATEEQKNATDIVQVTLAKTRVWLAIFYRLSGQTEKSSATLARAAEIIDNLTQRVRSFEKVAISEDELKKVRAFYALQHGHLQINIKNAQAEADYQRSLQLYHSLGYQWESATALESLSMVAQAIGDLDKAKHYIEQSLTIRRQIEDVRGIATALSTLSTILRFQGDIENAIRFARESNQLYRSAGDQLSTAEGLQSLGMTLNHIGDFAEGLEHIEQSIPLYRSLNNSSGLVKAHANASHVSACLGQYDRASYHASETTDIAEAINDLRWLAQGYTLMAWQSVVAERFEQAQGYAEKSLALSKGAGGHVEEDIARSVMAYAYAGQGNAEKARKLFMEILHISHREKDFLPLITAVPKIVLMMLEEDEAQRAEDEQGQNDDWQRQALIAYAVISRWPVVAKSQLMEGPITRRLQPTLEQISAAALSEAESHAATLEIWDVVADLIKSLPQRGW